MGIMYIAVKNFCKGVLSLYFRKIYVIGAENIPQDGPVIICGNHANQFIDPMMIISHCDREICFTMAASSYAKPVVGQIAKLMNVIPVFRPEDSKKKGAGKVKIISETHIKGIGTNFIEQSRSFFENGSSGITVGNKTLLIEKIIDAENLLIKENKEANITPGATEYEYFFLPKLDNSILFKQVYDKLLNDGCICIFPEGTSHDRSELIKLKAGIALMTLGAMSETNCKNVKIVPVGLNYFKREEFRSEVIIEIGKPFEVPSEWGQEYKTNKRVSTEKLLKEIEARMKSVTLSAPSYQELRSLFFVRKLYVPPDTDLSFTQYMELCKRFSKGYGKLKDRDTTKDIMRKVNNYIGELESTGINDHEVKNIRFTYVWIVRKSFWTFVLFHIYLTLCLPAIIILSPIGLLIRRKAEKERIAAKAKNPNKIEALDVVSSVKVVQSILYLPLICLLWILLFYYCFNKHIMCGSLTTIALGLLLFPIYFYFSAKMLDNILFYTYTMMSRFLYFVYPKKIVKLKNQRENLTNELMEFVDKNINEVDPKFQDERIILMKKNENEKDELIRRNSQRKSKKHMIEELSKIFLNN